MTAQLAPVTASDVPTPLIVGTRLAGFRPLPRQRPRRGSYPRWRTPATLIDRSVPGWSTEADFGIRRTAADQLPDAATASWTFASALVEVMSGRRPDRQLRTHCAPEVFGGLRTLMAVMPGEPPRLLSLHVSEPADGVAEVCATFRRRARVAAMAFRLQGIDGRWRMTDLEVG